MQQQQNGRLISFRWIRLCVCPMVDFILAC